MIKTIWISALLVTCFAHHTFASNAEQPTWSQLNALYGVNIKSPVLVAFIDKYKLKNQSKPRSLDPRDNSYSISYDNRNEVVDTVTLQVAPFPDGYGEPYWAPYAGELPYGLLKTDKKADITQKLGNPLEIFGPGVYSDIWDYREHRIWVSFEGKDSHIREICFWKRPQAPK